MENTDRFVTYLNNLDSQYYFFVAGNLIGKIPTPFHKPQITQRIVSFLKNPQNMGNLFASLDDMDIRYLTLVHLLGSASDKDVFTFFPEDGFALIITRMETLCDKLVVIKDQGRYELNPILRNAMVLGVLDVNRALGENVTVDEEHPIVDKNVIFAILNLYLSGAIPSREANFHHFVKSDKLDTLFPQFEKARILDVLRTISDFIIGRIGSCTLSGNGNETGSQKNLKAVLAMDPASFAIHAIANAVNDRRLFVETSLSRLLEILKIHSLTQRQALAILQICSGCEERKANEILNHMFSFSLVVEKEGILCSNRRLWEPRESRSELRTDSNMSVSYYGLAHEKDILYRFANAMVCDKFISYQITKDSYTRGLESGLTQQQILDFLGDSSHRAVFDQWEKAFRRVQAYSGILLRCQDEQAAQIVRMHPEIQGNIIMDLGNSMFLMNRNTFFSWEGPLARALDQQHIDLVEPPTTDKDPLADMEESRSYDAFGFDEVQTPAEHKESKDWKTIADQLLQEATAKGCLNAEVEALIQARMIYSTSQLDSSFNYTSLISVSGFDFNAKTTLLRDVIKAKNAIVVLELPSETIVVKPFEIVKGEGKNSILKAKVLPQGIEKSIPISGIFKITVVRK